MLIYLLFTSSRLCECFWQNKDDDPGVFYFLLESQFSVILRWGSDDILFTVQYISIVWKTNKTSLTSQYK